MPMAIGSRSTATMGPTKPARRSATAKRPEPQPQSTTLAGRWASTQRTMASTTGRGV